MAQTAIQLQVGTSTPVLLWQTSTGIAPEDPITAKQGNSQSQIFQAGTFSDPVPIVIQNLDASNPVYLGPYNVASNSGVRLNAGASITRNIVGNDSEYAISTGGTVSVAVEVGRT